MFFYDVSGVGVPPCNISRALKREGWLKKAAEHKFKERNTDLQDAYAPYVLNFPSYHLMVVDEPGCDKRVGFRQTGWTPSGTCRTFPLSEKRCQDTISS
jgi:hypothetical protein